MDSPRRPEMPEGIECELSVLPQAPDEKERYNFDRATNLLMRTLYNSEDFMGPQIEQTFNPEFMEGLESVEGNTNLSQFVRNGGRVYHDMSKPEYCTPECPDPYQVVVYDQAMMAMLQKTAERAEKFAGYPIRLLKRNSDGHGGTYGNHENYCVLPRLYRKLIHEPLNPVQVVWATFQLVRSVLTGAGKVGVEESDETGVVFQLTQRLDMLETFRRKSTTTDRPIIEMRDQPHANKKRWQRLHYIMGDANMCETSTFLKMGLSSLLLMILQDEGRTSWSLPVIEYRNRGNYLENRSPDKAYPSIGKKISWDVQMQEKYDVTFYQRNASGDEWFSLTAPEILAYYIERMTLYVNERTFSNPEEQKVYQRVVKTANECLQKIRDGNARALFGVLDWPTKRGICEQALLELNKSWDDARKEPDVRRFLKSLADHAYCRLDHGMGLYWRLMRDGQITRIASEDEVRFAMYNHGRIRSELRSMIVDKWHAYIKPWGTVKNHRQSVDWNVIYMDHPERADDAWEVKMPDPKVVVTDMIRAAIELSRDPRELNERLNKLITEQRKKVGRYAT